MSDNRPSPANSCLFVVVLLALAALAIAAVVVGAR